MDLFWIEDVGDSNKILYVSPTFKSWWGRNPDDVYKVVSKSFEEHYGLIWLSPFGFNNTYTLTMRSESAKLLGIRTISDLAAYIRTSTK